MSTDVAVYAPGLRPLASKPSADLKYVFGFHAENHGETFAVVCLSIDGKLTKRVMVYDSFVKRQREVSFNDLAAELRRHGGEKYNAVQIAWERAAEPFAERLRDLDCAMLRDESVYTETPEIARRITMELEERMKLGTFEVLANNTAWIEEHKRFGLDSDGQIPLEGFPLMSATRHAYANLDRARTPNEKTAPIVYPKRRYI
jgi:hypothetical protein